MRSIVFPPKSQTGFFSPMCMWGAELLFTSLVNVTGGRSGIPPAGEAARNGRRSTIRPSAPIQQTMHHGTVRSNGLWPPCGLRVGAARWPLKEVCYPPTGDRKTP